MGQSRTKLRKLDHSPGAALSHLVAAVFVECRKTRAGPAFLFDRQVTTIDSLETARQQCLAILRVAPPFQPERRISSDRGHYGIASIDIIQSI
jgi:hypothetical protein